MSASPNPNDREEVPGQQSMFESGSPERAPSNRKRGSAHLKGTRALERLRNRIDLAVKELHRLREENTVLRREMEAVQNRKDDTVDGTQVVFTESPDELRQKLEDYLALVNELIEAESNKAPSEEAGS